MGLIGKILWVLFDIIAFIILIPVVIVKFVLNWLNWKKTKPKEFEAEFTVKDADK